MKRPAFMERDGLSVLSSQQEIAQAIEDFNNGRFGEIGHSPRNTPQQGETP